MFTKKKISMLIGILLVLILPLSGGVFSEENIVYAQDENPTLYAEINFDWVDGWNWPLDQWVDLTILEPGNPVPVYEAESQVGMHEWVEATYVRFDVWEDGFNLKPGHTVTLTSSTTTKTHIALNIGITQVNLTDNIVIGYAERDTVLTVTAHDPCWKSIEVVANGANYIEEGYAYWQADFNGLCVLNTVEFIHAEQQGSEEDGVSTGYFWSPPPPPTPPTLYAEINFDWVDGWNWPLGNTIALTIKVSEDGDIIYEAESQVYEWDDATYVRFDVWEDDFDVEPGQFFILEDTQTGVRKTHTALKIGIIQVDLTDNIVRGYAERDATLSVNSHTPCWETVEVIADGDDYIDEGFAYWQVDFDGICPLNTVEFIHAEQQGSEEDGVSTGYFWSPSPSQNIYLWSDVVTVQAYDELVLRSGWRACTPGLVTAFVKAAHVDLTINGDPLYPEGDDTLYWDPIEPFEFEGCTVAPNGNQASVSRWRYPLGSLLPGTYEVYAHMWLDHPIIDGRDEDGDGQMDVYKGTIIENTFTIVVK